MVDVLLEPMRDRHRELLGTLDPVELVEEAPVVDVEISVDQDVSQADGLGEACAEGARDHGVRGERAERLGIGLWSGGAGSREDVQGDVARSRRRTTTGSTGKALLTQSLGEPGIQHAAQVGLVQIAPQDALGYVGTSLRQWLAQQAAPFEHAMAQWRRSVLEDDEIDRVRSQALARVAEEGEALSPAGSVVELPAKNHGEIDVRPRPAAASGPRAEQVDRGKVRVAAPSSSRRVDSIGEVLGHPTLRKHARL